MLFAGECPGGGGSGAVAVLTSNILVYLTGFSKRRNRAKNRKNSPEYANGVHEIRAFTMFKFTMIAVSRNEPFLNPPKGAKRRTGSRRRYSVRAGSGGTPLQAWFRVLADGK
jgi:hypothetical protein